MSNDLTLFNFNNNPIRVIDMGGEPWFPAKDVCDILGLGNVTQALINFTSNEVKELKLTSGRGRANKLVSESGLYKLVMQSRKPQAQAFKHWVTSTVLPAIRKDGMYVVGEEKVATGELTEDEFILMAMEKLKAKTDRLQKAVDDHLKYMTIDEFFALKHIYPGRGDSTAMGHRASKLCRTGGYEKRLQRRYAPSVGHVVEIGEYPVSVLEQAYSSMVEDGRIPSFIPQMDLGLVEVAA